VIKVILFPSGPVVAVPVSKPGYLIRVGISLSEGEHYNNRAAQLLSWE
jgi:hypothetical protein